MDYRSDKNKTPLLEKRKKAIKEKALDLILQHGIANTTMKDIALHCGIGRKTLYRFFLDIEDIAQQLLIDFASSPDSFTASYKICGASSREQLSHASYAWYEYCLNHEQMLLFYFEYDYYFRTPKRELIHEFWKTKLNVFEVILQQGVEDGSFALTPETVHATSLVIANSIIATLQRVLPRKEVYQVEYGFTVHDISILVDLLMSGLVKK